MLESGQLKRLSILGLDERGHGVGSLGDFTIHVAGTAPGDDVTGRIEHVSPHRADAWAGLETVHERGSNFRTPDCPNAAPLRGECGGCPALHIHRDAQLAWKLAQTQAALSELPVVPETLHTRGPRLGYRTRTNYVYGLLDNKPVLGSWAPRSHNLAAMAGCLAVQPVIADVASSLEALLAEHEMPARPATPALRYVTVRAGTAGDLLVDFVVEAKDMAVLPALADDTCALDPVVGVSVAVNHSKGNAIRVAESTVIRGRETVDEVTGDIVLTPSASSFTQLNNAVAVAMYQQGATWLAEHLPDGATVFDLYCGLGGLGMTLAHHRDDVSIAGAESHEAAVRLANAAALRNSLQERCRFVAQDLRHSVIAGGAPPDGILVNPPRRGIDDTQLDFIARSCVPTVYMSCSPPSFARDVLTLRQAGLELTAVQAWDMLPQTAHVELLGLLMPAH